ncbi:MAG: hypothetical protein GX481_08910, partial [Atopobium sp.]|nr:hypothetical protein [Atopobium sp.]
MNVELTPEEKKSIEDLTDKIRIEVMIKANSLNLYDLILLDLKEHNECDGPAEGLKFQVEHFSDYYDLVELTNYISGLATDWVKDNSRKELPTWSETADEFSNFLNNEARKLWSLKAKIAKTAIERTFIEMATSPTAVYEDAVTECKEEAAFAIKRAREGNNYFLEGISRRWKINENKITTLEDVTVQYFSASTRRHANYLKENDTDLYKALQDQIKAISKAIVTNRPEDAGIILTEEEDKLEAFQINARPATLTSLVDKVSKSAFADKLTAEGITEKMNLIAMEQKGKPEITTYASVNFDPAIESGIHLTLEDKMIYESVCSFVASEYTLVTPAMIYKHLHNGSDPEPKDIEHIDQIMRKLNQGMIKIDCHE